MPAGPPRYHFIKSGVRGHPIGMLASDAGLFITDLNPIGCFEDSIRAGKTVLTLNVDNADRADVIYLVSPIVATVPEPAT